MITSGPLRGSLIWPPTSLRDVLVWLLLWLMVSIPAFALLSVWLRVRDSVSGTLRGFIEMVKNGAARRAQSAKDARNSVMERIRLVEIDEAASGAWQQSLSTVLEGVRSGGVQIERTRTDAHQMTKDLERSTQRIKKLKFVSAVIPEIPAMENALIQAKRHRSAGTNLFLSLLLLLPIMAANMQLTGLVLRELIPPVQPLLGIPVAVLIALILVIVEASIGVLHSVEAEKREESERKLTIASVVYTVAAMGVVVIEAMLYSTVQPDSGALRLPIGGSAFGLVGGILGLAVFGFGRLAYSSLMTLRKDRTPKVIAKQLDTLKDSAEGWNLVANRLEPKQNACVAAFKHLGDLCRDTAQAQGHAIEQFTHEIDKLRDTPPEWARPVERQLSQSEFAERESRAYFWLTVATIAAVSLVVICAHLTFRVTMITGASVGLGLAAAAFAAGALASQNSPRPTVWRITWYALLIAVLCGLAVSAVRFLRAPLGFLSAVLLIPALAAFAAGVQVGRMVSLLRLPLGWFGHRLTNTTLACLVGLFWLVNAVTALVEYVAQLIAWPTLAVVKAVRGATKVRAEAGTADVKAQRDATIA
jgi:hypothetical protein